MPRQITVRASGPTIDLTLAFTVDRTVKTAMGLTAAVPGSPTDFLQLGGPFHVTGRVGDRAIDVTARGAAETFR
jgi:hypothetical protein